MSEDTKSRRESPDDGNGYPRATDREKIERLHGIAVELAACRTEREVYALTVEAAEGILAFDICGIDAVEDGWLVPKAVSAELADGGYERAPVDDGGLAGAAHRAGESIVVDDVRESAVADPADDEYRSALTVPVGDLAVFRAGSREVGAFDDTDRRLAELLLAHTEEALRRIRFEEALRERQETIERLQQTAAELVACGTEGAVYDLLVEAADRVLEFEVSVVLVDDDGGDRLRVRAAVGGEFAPDVGTEQSVDEGILGRTYRTGESILVEDVTDHQEATPYDERYGSAVSVPIGEFGVFQAIATEPGVYDEEDLELAELLVAQAAEVVSRLRAEGRLIDQHDRLAALFRNVPDPAVSLEFRDGEPIVLEANPAFEETFGYDGDELVGENLDEYIVPADRREEAIRLNRTAIVGGSTHRKVRRRTADGELRDFLIQVVPVERDPGNTLAFSIYTDITERERRAQRLSSLHESARELMAADDTAEVCAVAVEAAQDILGLSITGIYLRPEYADLPAGSVGRNETRSSEPPEAVAGRGVAAPPDSSTADGDERLEPVAYTTEVEALFGGPPPILTPSRPDVWSIFEAGEPTVLDDITVDQAADGAIESALVVPLGDHGLFVSGGGTSRTFDDQVVDLAGVLAANVEAALDRTEREQVLRERERELELQNERLDQFASVVSHDLRGPLSIARGNLELAHKTGDEEYLAKVERAHERMDQLIEDLLALARQGETAGDTRQVDLSAATREAWTVVEDTGATLSLADPPWIEADADRLVQLLGNLFRNAVEHAGPAPTITVGGLDADDGFYVADDGPGIPADEREQVFEHGHSTRRDGTGLGLAIVREIAEAHGWAVRATESEAGGARIEIVTG